ncbi:AAA family ATPase [Herbaspirillum sp. ST 5-3]|uniref:AAA family ATPase n=1 Tax=Oxalobacteraceae TaxID=75682 RepID=UPI0010A41B7E|nr:AAA family ATPase [Herbaspirillum sp. ST 5-3]
MFSKPTELESLNRKYLSKKLYAVILHLIGYTVFFWFFLIVSFINDVNREFRRLNDERDKEIEGSNSVNLFNQVQEQETNTFANQTESTTTGDLNKTTEEMVAEEYRLEAIKRVERTDDDDDDDGEDSEINVFMEAEEKEENNANAGVKLESILEDEEKIFNDVEKTVDELALKYSAKPPRLYPDDNGLFCIKNYIQSYLEDDFDFKDVDEIVDFYKGNSSAPDFLRNKIIRYLDQVEARLEEKYQVSKARSLHLLNVSAIQSFKEDSPDQHRIATEYLTECYIKETQGMEVSLPIADFRVGKNYHKWFDKRILAKVPKNNEDGDSSRHYRRILESDPVKEKLFAQNELVFDELENQFPNFREVIQFYKSQFRFNALADKNRFQPILLTGEPGIGKTMFARTLASKLNTGFSYVDMASTSTYWVLNGLNSSWKGAKPGKIFEAMLDSPTASPIVLLDEVDKSSQDAADNPLNALYQLLEEGSAKAFVDEFVECPVDISPMIFIACANGLDSLPDPLQTRFRIFHIQRPNQDEQKKIIQNIYKNEICDCSVFMDTLNEEVVSWLLDDAPRVAKGKISSAVSKVLLEHSKEELDKLQEENKKIEVSLSHFDKAKEPTKNKIGF